MTLAELLTVVRAADIRLEARGDRLVFDAPHGALTPELRATLAEQKPALLAWLAPVEFVTLKGGVTIPVPALRLALERALGELTRHQRDVFLLYEVEGFHHSEIAAMLEISETASKNTLFQAKKNLRMTLEPPRSSAAEAR